jgi:hypothetical protein
MLAYVFWHWPQSAVTPDEYEETQRAFHAALKADPSPGFRGSTSYAVAGYPWVPGSRPAYEDWYLVDGSAALDPLNEAAVTASRLAPHDAAAKLAEGGTAGIYRLRLPAELPANLPQRGQESWFSRPSGMSYDALWSLMGRIIEDHQAQLWIRHMVLGPSPEFCLQSREPLRLPPPITPLTIPLRPVWP